MNRSSPALLKSTFLLAVGLALGGCSHGPPPGPGAAEPPKVTVSLPLRQEITDYAEYTGRTAAVDSVEVRARVTGYLQKINFKEGADVKANEVLYEIDPRPYRAALTQAQAQVSLQQANLRYNRATYERNRKLASTNTGAISAEEVEQSLAQFEATEASLNAARAGVEQAQLNLGWTKVTSPIDGIIGRTLVTQGNLVVADQTVLTSIVSQDPMYAYFDVDEPTMLRVRQLIREGKYKSARDPGSRVPVFLGLTTEKGYPHEGYLDFINNQVVSTTGTLPIRGIFQNPAPSAGPRLLTPGLFVRVKVAVSAPYDALLVTQAAVGTDQNVKFLLVVDDQNKVERRDVQLGPMWGNDLQVVTSGLKPDDHVIVEGTQHARPGEAVKPRLVPMPVPSQPGTQPPPAVKGPSPPAGQPSQPAPAQQQNEPPHGQSR